MQEKPKRKVNWSSAIGWIIFILVIAGGPLLQTLQQLLRGVVSFPANSVSYLIGALVALSLIVTALRAVGQTSRGRSNSSDTRLPSGLPPSANTPRPPFGGPSLPARPPGAAAQPGLARRNASGDQRLPSAPGFEPIINPIILIVGLVGIAVIGGIALLLLGQNLP